MENLNTKNEIANEAPLTVDNITGRPILDHDDSKEEIVNDLAIATLDTLLGSSIVEIEQSLVKDLKVIVISKGGHWYENIKIEGKNKYIKPANKYLQNSNIRDEGFDILTQHETRPHNDRDREIYKEAILAWDTRKERLCYKELSTRRSDLITHKNTTSFTNRFNVIKADERASHTILAHMAMDGHYYIHPDIKQLRSLSIREAARLQSFPDDFYFEGPRTAIFRQIGNAVPPKMAEQIAKKIKEIL